MINPRVTVLMPVYNGEKYLKEAIDSILNQTFKDFEFLIINDGSTDNTKSIIESYADIRIRLINQNNQGISAALNKGISLSQGKYIVRMDADDISRRYRLAIQVKFMDNNEDVAVCGSFLKTFGESNKRWKTFTDYEDIKVNMLFNCPLYHPTVIMRKKYFDKYHLHYSKKYAFAEDYGLWKEISKKGRIVNIPKVLLDYRLHKTNLSTVHYKKQMEAANIIRLLQLKKIGINLDEAKIALAVFINNSDKPLLTQEVNKFGEWLVMINNLNEKKQIYSPQILKKVLGAIWYDFLSRNLNIGKKIIKIYFHSRISQYLNSIQKFKFIIKYLFYKKS